MSAPGVCRFCGCHGPDADDACKVPGGDTCVWMDQSRDVCTGIACQARYAAEQRREAREAAAARPRKPSPGKIHQIIKDERNARRRAARAKRKQRGAA